MVEPGAMLARQVRPGDRIYSPTIVRDDQTRTERTVLSVDPNLDGFVEVEFTDGSLKIYRATQTVLVLSP
jgi:hypothetical protein